MPQKKEQKLTIDTLSPSGEGVASFEGKKFYIPLTVPGDEIVAEISPKTQKGVVKEFISKSPNRSEPPCSYFGTCGGCLLQHLSEDDYRKIKRTKIIRSLEKAGVECKEISPTVILPVKSRRRATLRAVKAKGAVVLGFYKRESNDIVDITSCEVLESTLEALLQPLKSLLENIEFKKVEISLTKATQGADIVFDFKKDLSLEIQEQLIEFARKNGVLRVSVIAHGFSDVLYQEKKPEVLFDGVPVPITPKAFLQASAEADEILSQKVLELIPKKTKVVADLFCGRGTFSLPLSSMYKVKAYDTEEEAVETLKQVSLKNGRPVETFVRNLFSYPLLPQEMEKVDVVVLDPPRLGAMKQCEALARSTVRHIIYVSCSADTFSRDALTLTEGGFSLETLTPIDQFVWTSHIESIGFFTRKK